ncbi:hypothetical protein ACQ86I_19890 [Prescottella equi]
MSRRAMAALLHTVRNQSRDVTLTFGECGVRVASRCRLEIAGQSGQVTGQQAQRCEVAGAERTVVAVEETHESARPTGQIQVHRADRAQAPGAQIVPHVGGRTGGQVL